MNKLDGFKEGFGIELEKKDYMDSVMKDVATKFRYSEIHVPTIEDAGSYSEELVGNSPWPEWNPKGCFFFTIKNYHDSYKSGEEQEVVLIPEGTVSVTRWLANRMDSHIESELPIKLFYSLNCYRNELISTLNANKRREFKQFGLEILGSSSKQSDSEIMYLITHILVQLGVSLSQIRIRLNDIRIFTKLTHECNIAQSHSLALKELLDSIAEARAGKHPETLENDVCAVYGIINQYNLDQRQLLCWKALIEHNVYPIEWIIEVFGNDYREIFELLLEYRYQFSRIGVRIEIDLCVIRSHEYYTGLSFEVDVITEKNKYIEIAGGGRYDRLVGKFLAKADETTIPCTGFAFGTERVLSLMDDLNCFAQSMDFTRRYFFDMHAKRIVLSNPSIESYISAISELHQFPVDIVFAE